MIICFLSWTRKNKNTYDPVTWCKDQRIFPNLKKKNLIPHPPSLLLTFLEQVNSIWNLEVYLL